MPDAGMNRTRARAFLGALLLAGMVLAAGLVLYRPYLDLFIFTEARQYVHDAGAVEDPASYLPEFVMPLGWNNRPASMLAFWAMRRACGYGWRCLNAAQIGLVLAGAVLLWCHGLQVLRNRALATGLALVWLASPPVLDAVTWQATNHDKLAAVCVLAVLVVLHRACSAPHSRRVLTGMSAALAVLTALALNAKESAFFLLALLPVAAGLWSLPQGRRGMLRGGLVVLPATAFCAHYVAIYLMRLDASWAGHVLSAGATGHLGDFAAYLGGALRPGGVQTGICLAAGAALALLLLWHARSARSVSALLARPDIRAALYFACLFASAALLAVKTQFPRPYYMYIPAIGWYGLLMAMALGLGRGRPAVPRAVGALAIALACLTLASSLRLQASEGTLHAGLLAASKELSRQLPALRQRLPPDPGRPYTVVVSQDVKCFFHFLRSGSGGIDHTLPNFLYGTGGDFSVRRVSPPQFRRNAIASDERVLVLDGRCGIRAAYDGRRRVL